MVRGLARGRAGQRLDPAHAGRDAALADHRDQARYRRCAAHACRRTVPPTSPGCCRCPSPIATTRTSSPYFSPNSARAPEAMRIVDRHQPRRHRRVLQHDVVGDVLDALDLVRAHRLGMREVEAQPVGRDQRALLRHVVAEHLAQRLVQQMRRRMVLRGWRCGARDRPSSASAAPTLSAPSSTVPRCTNRSPAFFCVSVTGSARRPRSSCRCRRPGRRTRHRTASG